MPQPDQTVIRPSPAVPPPGPSVSIDELVQQQSESIYTVSTVFPFKFFPTTISIDKNKVDVIERVFIGSKQITSILITDIMSVVVETSLFFAQLTIHSKLPMSAPIVVEYLPRQGALKMRRIIEGLLIGEKENVDLSRVSKAKLVKNLETIGTAKSTS